MVNILIYIAGIILLYLIIAYFLKVYPFYPLSGIKGKIKGKVRLSSYKNHSGVTVRIGHISQDKNNLDIDYFTENGKIKEVITDAGGEFLLTDIPAGNWWVIMEKKGFPLKMKLITLKEDGKTVDIGTIKLE